MTQKFADPLLPLRAEGGVRSSCWPPQRPPSCLEQSLAFNELWLLIDYVTK